MKNLTWANTFEIIEKLLEYNQQGLADTFGVSSSTIKRMKSGESIRANSVTAKIIYDRIFDLNNPKSPMLQLAKKEQGALEHLKEVIVGLNLRPLLEDIWENKEKDTFVGSYKNGDYKKFILTLLHRTSNKDLSESESKEKTSLGSNKKNEIESADNQSETEIKPQDNAMSVDNADSGHSPEQAKTMQLPISSEPTEFDEKFDLSAKKLRKAFKKFQQEDLECDNTGEFIFETDILGSFDKFRSGDLKCKDLDESFFASLFAALEMTVEAGKLVANPAGELKVFLNVLTNIMDEWNKVTSQFPYNESVSGFLKELVRKKLGLALHNYFLFSEDYLRNRHIDVSQYATPREKIAAIFKQAAKDWGVEDFIYNRAESNSFLDVGNFAKDIDDRLSYYDVDETIIAQINKFIDMLNGQMLFSVHDSDNIGCDFSMNLEDDVKNNNCDNRKKISEILSAIVDSRKDLIALYEEICSMQPQNKVPLP
ncbi:MAG: hypothetical protein FWG63_02725 [Defluviitaleaceae bacterium]|nr:hypothetical protein [Defluviitaleaceae bacterium]